MTAANVNGVQRRLWAVVAFALAALSCAAAAAGARPVSPLLGFWRVTTGPSGGSVWAGTIPNPVVPIPTGPGAIYLPPGYTPSVRYPVVYLLHGMPGSPSSFYVSLRLARVADGLIAERRVPPFIAVMPRGGTTVHATTEEWTGPWERYLVEDVVPWVDAHLPTIADPRARTLAGLSAGGFGAVDIGLRHPGVFGTLEAWDGYFTPFRDGSLSRATPAELAANTPTLLVRRRGAPVRFFLSTGDRHGGVDPRWTLSFAHELAALSIPYELWVLPPGGQHYYRAQLPAALEYALQGAGALARRG